MALKFDLIDEPWIPVDVGGSPTELSLLDVLLRAHELAGLAPEVPTMVPAILRQVLLPVVLDVFGVPTSTADWGGRWNKGRLQPQPVRNYLDTHRDRFDLFHPTQPFGQVADLRTSSNETKPSSLLVPAVATGNNVPLFSARTEADPVPLPPAHAARWMLNAQCFDTAGIKSGAEGDSNTKAGKTTGNPVGSLGKLGLIVPEGRNLFETVLLNLLIVPDGLETADIPIWRRPPATARWTLRPAIGLLDLLTFQSRRIRLLPQDQSGSITVSDIVIAAGDRLLQTPDSYEPHTAWKRVKDPKKGEGPVRPIRHEAGRFAWQGLGALLTLASADEHAGRYTSSLLEQIGKLKQRELDPLFPLRILTVGVEYGNQQAVVENVISDEIPLPVVALQSDNQVRVFVAEVVDQSEELSRILNRLDSNLRRAAGGDAVAWNKGQHPSEFFIQRVDPYVRRILSGLQREPNRLEEAREVWWEIARRSAVEVADDLLADLPPGTFIGHRDTSKGPGKKKGEDSVINLAAAESWFWQSLNRILPRSAAQSEEVGIAAN